MVQAGSIVRLHGPWALLPGCDLYGVLDLPKPGAIGDLLAPVCVAPFASNCIGVFDLLLFGVLRDVGDRLE